MRRLWLVKQYIIAAILLAFALIGPKDAESYGDRMQFALPVVGLGCAIIGGGTGEYLLRYGAMFTVLHGSKRGLGDLPINIRPHGGGHGFPSGHTATAVFGASALVHTCLRSSPILRGAVLVSAGYVGASRIEAGAHDIWQVLAGALLGWLADRLFRKKSPARQRFGSGFAAFAARTRKNSRAVPQIAARYAVAVVDGFFQTIDLAPQHKRSKS